MSLDQLLQIYQKDQRTKQIINTLNDAPQSRLYLSGMVGSLDSMIAAATYRSQQQTHLFILETKDEAGYFQNDLKNLLETKSVLYFPDSFKKPGYLDEINKSNVLLRAETASKLAHAEMQGQLLVTYPEAFFEKIVNTKTLQQNTILIQKEEQLDVDFVVEVLVEYGFERTDFVYEPGQFAVRGGIVDIYSFGNDLPYRVELFGDEVDSIRIFDPLTQLSTQKLSKVTIVPNIQTQFGSGDKASLFHITPDNTTVWIKDLDALLSINEKCYKKAVDAAKTFQESHPEEEHVIFTDDPETTFLSTQELFRDLQDKHIIEFGRAAYFKDSTTIHYSSKPQPPFNKNFELLIKDLEANDEEGYKNILFAENPRQINRFANIFEDVGTAVRFDAYSTSVHEGFKDDHLKLAIYTDHQIFERFYKYKVKQGYSKDKAMTIRMLKELQPRDYVTHIDHGVGQYAGLVKITVNGKQQEVMKIIYKGKDILYVNVNSLHKVSKYVGKDGKVPKINKLGSDAWQALKRKTKRKIKDIAADLIKLYAKRKASKGFAFSPDTYMQTELEASFMYEDTPDQYKATQDFKVDMEAENPMDRLICGDVGFGKTEVAVRAAAKAIADSKQVAVLVPTTILAMQHFKTFSERLSIFPCTVDYLNRFKTTKQKNETLKKLEAGGVDVVIGTHALLGKKVKFKDLGLLIIDEEQKFGVAAKEKLRGLKVNVDTLTLTATPIPRTLQFSLMNARDLTVINTPPPNRQPVSTELIGFDPERIREAINYEVYRGGQVFFIHNRVKDLTEIAAMIKRLCPDIDVGMAHGQLENKELEEKMMKFISNQYDVLVCTNIVESGLDVSNANTIIINNAQNFGLSDLHQLRGRVGRSNRKAFCYLITPPLYSLPDDSRKRLKAIEQFADLGSGFQIAMKDLDIRGAGNLLGGEQSGFIADIGFEMYQKILNEAIQELKETDFKDVFQEQREKERSFVQDCQIDTDLELLIPDNYVNNVSTRLSLYTELDNIATEEGILTFRDKLRDQFGPLPSQVKELFHTVRLRWVAKKLGFERISFKQRKLRGYFPENQSSPYYESSIFSKILKYVQRNSAKAHFKQTNKHFLIIFDGVSSMHTARELLLEIEDFVNKMEANP